MAYLNRLNNNVIALLLYEECPFPSLFRPYAESRMRNFPLAVCFVRLLCLRPGWSAVDERCLLILFSLRAWE